MDVSVEELLKGQSTLIRNKQFLSTERYVKPFLEKMSGLTDRFECKAIPPTQVSIERNGEVNTLYNKVLVEAVIPIDGIYSEVVGMAYAIDTKTPICKFFRGIKEDLESLHLFIDTDNNIINQEIEPEMQLNYGLINKLLEKEFKTFEWVENLKTIDFDATNDNVNFNLGQWIRFAINFSVNNEFGTVKVAAQDIVAGYKELFENSKSNYFCGLGGHTNYLKIYNAFSKIIYDGKDIVNVADKTYLLKSILSLV